LPHFHDELVLKCLKCKSHTDTVCDPMVALKEKIESLYPFYLPNTKERVFKLDFKKKE